MSEFPSVCSSICFSNDSASVVTRSSKETCALPTNLRRQRFVDLTSLSNAPPHHGARSTLNIQSVLRLVRYSLTVPSLKTFLQGRRNQGGKGGSSPPAQKSRGAEPPYKSGPVSMGLQLQYSCMLLDHLVYRARDAAYCHTSLLLAMHSLATYLVKIILPSYSD